MTRPCELRPIDKRKLVNDVGERLVKRHGKRRHYSPEDVRIAATEAGYAADWHCWAMCVFTSPDDFKALHETIGEACDYLAMRAQVVTELLPVSGTGGEGIITGTVQTITENLDLSWLEWPDIDWAGMFEWFDWS